jgi:YD repeat-containing protein
MGPGWRHTFEERLYVGYDAGAGTLTANLAKLRSDLSTALAKARRNHEGALSDARAAVAGYTALAGDADALAAQWRELLRHAKVVVADGSSLARRAQAARRALSRRRDLAERVRREAAELYRDLETLIDRHRTLRRRADYSARHAESARRAFQSILDFLAGRRIDTNWERNALAAATANAATARGRNRAARDHYDNLDGSVDRAENALESVHGLGAAEHDALTALLADTSDAIEQLAVLPATYDQSAAVRRSADGLALVEQLRDEQIGPGLAAAQELREEIEVAGAAMLGAMEEALREVDDELEAASRRADYASVARRLNRGHSGAGAMTRLEPASGAGTFILVSPRGRIRVFRHAASLEQSPVQEAPMQEAPGIARFYMEADGGYSLLEADGEIRRFDRWGRLTEIARLQGARLTLSYADGLLLRITDELGRSLELGYSDGLLTSVSGPAGRKVDFGFDANGRLIVVRDPVGAETRYAYSDHRITRIQVPDGSARSYHYEAFGEGFRVTSTEDELGNREHFRYDPVPAGGVTEHESYGGSVTRYHYDRHFHTVLRERLAADGRVLSREALTYTGEGRLRLREIGGDGIQRSRHLEYDAAGNLRSRRDPDGVTERWEYNSRNQVIRHRGADGRTTTFDYDGRGRLVGEYRSNGGAVEYRYSGAGNVVQRRERINGAWQITRYEYDSFGHLTAIRHPDGGTELFAHNAYGELVEHTNVLGLKRSLSRREDGRVTEVRTQSGGTVTTEALHYDAGKRVVRHVDRAGREQRFSYDARGLLIEVEAERYFDEASGEAVTDTSTFAYDAGGRLTEKRIGEVGQWRGHHRCHLPLCV